MQENDLILKIFMLKYEGVERHHVCNLEMILQNINKAHSLHSGGIKPTEGSHCTGPSA